MPKDVRGNEVEVGQRFALHGTVTEVGADGSVTVQPDAATTAEFEAHAALEAEWQTRRAALPPGQLPEDPCPRLERAENPLVIHDARLIEVHVEPRL